MLLSVERAGQSLGESVGFCDVVGFFVDRSESSDGDIGGDEVSGSKKMLLVLGNICKLR